MFRTDFIIHEPEESYHAQSKNGEYMSSHMLADFRNSPMLYRKEVNGEIAEKPCAAFTFGSAAHKVVLEGRVAFDAEYIVSDGPMNPKTGAAFGATTKAYMEWLATQDKKVVSGSDWSMILSFWNSVQNHPAAREMLATGIAEGVARAELHGVKCQIRMDFFNPDVGLIDYKTCAELRWFESDCRRYGYIHQLAFYRAVIRQLIGVDVPVYIIATEKCEPYSTGVWQITPEVLTQAEEINTAALERYKQCIDTGYWPTNYENTRLIDTL